MTNHNGYENAPATKMVATHCACCARPLVDAPSVERGIGPDCARKYGFADAQGPADWNKALDLVNDSLPESCLEYWDKDPRKVANILVHAIACNTRAAECRDFIRIVSALGYVKLAVKLAEATGACTVSLVDGMYIVSTPFSHEWNDAVWQVKGQRWDPQRKVRVVPAKERQALWMALCCAFPGKLCIGAHPLRNGKIGYRLSPLIVE